jgi:hypothetical protein
MVHIASKKWCKVWSSLADNEVVYIEEFANTM